MRQVSYQQKYLFAHSRTKRCGHEGFPHFLPDLLMPTHSHDGFNLALKSTILLIIFA